MTCYLLGVLLISLSKSVIYLGTFTIIISPGCTEVSGAKRVFMYSFQGMLGKFFCKSSMVIGLYKEVAFLRFSLGKEIYKIIINKT